MDAPTDNKQPLFYDIVGPDVLKNRIPLYEVIGTLREYSNIIDRSYLTLTGKERLSKKEREKYQIIAYKFDPGSLHIDLAIELMELLQLTFPFMMPTGAVGLWNVTKASYNFVKTVTELRTKDIDPVIKEDNSVQNYIIGDNNQIVVNPAIAITGEKIEESVQKIGNYIRPGSVDKVALTDPKEEGILITEKEKTLFNPDTTISENAETIVVKIYRLDIESKRGKLHILEGMEPADISFQIIGDQAMPPYIDALKADQVEVNILRETALSITGKPYIKRILLIGLAGNNSEQRNLF